MVWWGGGGWWVVGAIVLVACMFWMGRMMMGHGWSGHDGHDHFEHSQGNRDATEILAERFARGEISEEEFEQRKRVLTYQK
jgi:putative membrane protein